MLTKITIKNFKRFKEDAIELGDPVVFIGPNNSGKTSALQSLALWETGLKRWSEKRKGARTPEKRTGVAVNRRDLVSVPIPSAKLLWRNLKVRDVTFEQDKQDTKYVRIDIIVEGVSAGRAWKCGLEFDYANEESFYVRPLRITEERDPDRMPIPDAALDTHVAFLPPMSGLAANETRLDSGAVNVRVGEGRTAEVLRNLCFTVFSSDEAHWDALVERIYNLFGSRLGTPMYVAERGEISLTYEEHGIHMDISSSGRGLQQTLLLLTYMYANPKAVLLLDEPDAHLEILRQRQIYDILTKTARETSNQIIAASHSEVLLQEAGSRDVVIAFLGSPHRIDDRGSQLLKALREIGFEEYYQAEQVGWVLYLEGSTDLAILRVFADKLSHSHAQRALERPFVKYVANQPTEASKHYYGLKEASPDLRAFALFDRLDRNMPNELKEISYMWRKKEIENYICSPEVLESYVRYLATEATRGGPLFASSEMDRYLSCMRSAIRKVEDYIEASGRPSPWGPDLKVSDEFLRPVFNIFFKDLGLPNIMAKKNYHELARHIAADSIDEEVVGVLDRIAEVAEISD